MKIIDIDIDSSKTQLTIELTLFLLKILTKNEQFIQKVMIYDNLDKTIEELFDSLLPRYQVGVATKMSVSDFIFDCVTNAIK